MARALKVFRTSAGFHDAYVAAPSRKAALEAWGADVDLFARGVAEQVSDQKLMAEPLKRPGEVIMKSRGGLADQLKALGPRKNKAKRATEQRDAAKPGRTRPVRPPRRDRLDAAEAALAETARRQEKERAALEAQRDELDRKMSALQARQAKEFARLKKRHDDVRDAYREALDRWSA